MAGELRTYDPEKITCTFSISGAGAIDLTRGLVDASGAITVSRDSAKWSRRSDRQGNVARIKSSKKGGTITLTYAAESEICDVLSGLSNADDQTEAITGQIVIKDLNGTTICSYLGAFIENVPSPVYGDMAADRAYVFGFAEAVEFLGGAGAL